MQETQTVQTVTGPVALSEMGLTLMHEHLFIDIARLWERPAEESRLPLASAPVSADILGELRFDPFVNLDNLSIQDPDLITEELMKFTDMGGQTVVDVTSRDNGRNPQALRAISHQTGLNIIMGCGYYLGSFHPARVKTLSIDDLADEIVSEVECGVDGTGIRPGIIGEAGISKDMTAEEIRLLRAQARAQVRTGLPLTIHLNGWDRTAHQILDITAEEGVRLNTVILDHMNPSGEDFDYQASLAERGAYLEYDMIGMDYLYPGLGQSPGDNENARAIQRLIAGGFLENILLSQDVFLKMMLTRYGGFGYSYILKFFIPRLRHCGVTEEQIHTMLVENPQRVFSGGQS